MQLIYSDAELLAKAIKDETGLVFANDKELDLKNAAIKTVEKFGIPSFQDLLSLVKEANLQSNEFKFFVENLTINETYFFRHFKALEENILPNLVKKKTNKNIRIWSAGCSSGEEVYTIAMVLNELIPRIKDWSISIKGTDIDSSVINIAKRGNYKKWSMRQISDYYKKKYFDIIDQSFQVNYTLKSYVDFSIHNLLSYDYPSNYSGTTGLDIILCRNVTIYFGLEDTAKIVTHFYKCLNFGGYLIVGHSEPSPFIYDQFEHQIIGDMVVYQKTKKIAKKDSVPVLEKKEKNKHPKTVKIKTVPSRETPTKTKQEMEELFLEATKAYESHNYDLALEKLSIVHVNAKHHVKANYLSALIYANLSKFDKSMPYLDLVLKEDSLHEEAYYLLSLIHKENKAYSEAIDSLKKAVYINKGFALAYYEMMVNLILLNEKDEAERVYKQLKRVVDPLKNDDDVGIIEHLKVENLKSLVCIFLGLKEF
jgi:chemotaxis protein methyltransferase CheR